MMKGDRVAMRSSFGNIVRKRLSDFTNSLPQPKSPAHDEKPSVSPTPSSAKDYIDNLLKENMALVKLVADKNKIIELSGMELQKLRVNLQKMQLQNWNLVQSNSRIVAELNLGKRKLKALQHELLCKDTLLKARNLEFQGPEKMNDQQNSSQEKQEAAGECKSNENNKICNGRRRQTTRSRSMGHKTTSQQVSEKETAQNKRQCLRRQSAIFQIKQWEPKDNLLEIKDAKFPVSQESPANAECSTPVDSSFRKGEKIEKCGSNSEARESQRTAFGRPLRKAVEKVQSYKEIPLNIKMRRSE